MSSDTHFNSLDDLKCYKDGIPVSGKKGKWYLEKWVVIWGKYPHLEPGWFLNRLKCKH